MRTSDDRITIVPSPHPNVHKIPRNTEINHVVLQDEMELAKNGIPVFLMSAARHRRKKLNNDDFLVNIGAISIGTWFL